MKNKISFTSVLKNKNPTRQSNTSNQYATESQNRHQRLIDIYQQFQTAPDQDYTLDLNSFRNMAYRSRNSSINLLRSKNVNEDPQMDLQTWIQSQKQSKQHTESFYRANQPNKEFKVALSTQQQNIPARKSKSTLKRAQYPPRENYEQQTIYYPMSCSEEEQNQMEESNSSKTADHQKASINFRSQNAQCIQEQQQREKNQMIQSSKVSPQQYFAAEQLKQKNYYPDLEQQEYQRLQDEFERMKSQKIAELCMQAKKSVKKQTIQQIISNALDNIYEDIENMAEQIKRSRQVNVPNSVNKRRSEEESQSMLISGQEKQSQQTGQLAEIQEEKRQQEMKNMIKSYITGIQEAKNQSRGSSSYNDHQPSFQQNTFNIEIQKPEQSHSYKNSTPIQSVGYSFSNTNMICEHSFSKELASNDNFSAPEGSFHRNTVQPPIYQPQNQNSDDQDQQRISLPNVEEVKSDCGDFHSEHHEVESSEQIEFRRNKYDTLALDMTGKNIKNIQSVHYEPPNESYSYSDYDKSYNANSNLNLFKNFQQPSNEKIENNYKSLNSPSVPKNELICRQRHYIEHNHSPKFVSKTFTSYLSGQMRSQYGQHCTEQIQKQIVHQINNMCSEQNINMVNSRSSNSNANYCQGVFHQRAFTIHNNPNHSLSQSIQQSCSENTVRPSAKMQNYSKINQSSSRFSLNQSVKEDSITRIEAITSPKNMHQLQSKNKFSINSPMSKIQQIMKNQPNKFNSFTSQFGGYYQSKSSGAIIDSKNLNVTLKSESPYAISSPVGEYQINQSFQQKVTENSHQKRVETKYACAESINQNNRVKNSSASKTYEFYYKNQTSNFEGNCNLSKNNKKNSILSMQPLKISIQNPVNQNYHNLGKASMQSHHIMKQSSNSNYYPVHRVVQSFQNKNLTIELPQPKPSTSYQANQNIQSIRSGRNYLQSLNTKQSIEIDLPSDKTQGIQDNKASFATETFRPSHYHQAVEDSIPSNSKTAFLNESSARNGNKISVTKITLKGSTDKHQVTSPKVISLLVNHLHQKGEGMKQFSVNSGNQKQNVFQKLTIKESLNLENQNSKRQSMHSNSNQSIKQSQNIGLLKQYNHIDSYQKENNNTLNQPTQKHDWKNDSMKFDLNLQQNTMNDSISTSKPSILAQNKEPLLKLSKNLNNSISQENGQHNSRKPLVESIKFKGNSSGSLVSSKIISIGRGYPVKQSFKGGVKQSIGNDSDLDFDLELD